MGAPDISAAAAGGAGGMPNVQTDPTTGMPVVTPEMQKQMSTMMRDPEMRKNMANMMKSMDPEMLKSMGITDKEQLEKASEALEKISPETLDRVMGFAMYAQRAYIFYKSNLWFRCSLQLVLMYMLYWMFGGWTMRTIGYFTGSSASTSASPAAPGSDPSAKVNAGEGSGERDWSGKASAAVLDDEVHMFCVPSSPACVCVRGAHAIESWARAGTDSLGTQDEDIHSAPETKHGRSRAASGTGGKASAPVSHDDEEL